MEPTTFICHQCKQQKPIQNTGGTGYATDNDENKICYDCCGINDAENLKFLKIGETATLYWDGGNIINWPGTLKIPVKSPGIWVTGFKRKTTHIEFIYAGQYYKALNTDNNQIARIRRVK